MARVLLNNLTKRFGEVVAVDRVDLEIRDREFLVLVGPSGCGKTTVLRMIAGLTEITEGEINIGERRVNTLAPQDRDIAMVFQNYALYPHMDVFANLSFGLRLRKRPRGEIQQRVREVAEMLGLQDLLQRRPAELSGGQRQRVAVGRAIVREPAVFLMDEPLSNLDAKLRVQTRAELSKLHRRLSITTIYVTHDQVEAMTMADRMAVMREGTLQQVGTPLEIFHQPANRFVAAFIGSPPMNFVEGTLLRREVTLAVATVGFTVSFPSGRSFARANDYLNRTVILGIRPNDLHDRAGASSALLAQGNTLQARVQVVEPLGAESILYLEAGGVPLMATVDSATRAEVDAPLDIVLDMAHAHLFDPDSEEAIL